MVRQPTISIPRCTIKRTKNRCSDSLECSSRTIYDSPNGKETIQMSYKWTDDCNVVYYGIVYGHIEYESILTCSNLDEP